MRRPRSWKKSAAIAAGAAALVAAGATGASFATTATTPHVPISYAYFNTTEAVQTFVVPTGVTTVQVQLWGAQTEDGREAGDLEWGGYVDGQLSVTPGETISVYVGGRGAAPTPYAPYSSPGGYNGGGAGGEVYASNLPHAYTAGGGSGATDIRVGGTALSDRLAVAGGAGGFGWYAADFGGAGGSNPGGNGLGGTVYGHGGSTTAGGAAGTKPSGTGISAVTAAAAGALGTGGHGVSYTTGSNTVFGAGGGGGGGYYGGGGGGASSTTGDSGGGGGSNYTGGLTGNITSSRGASDLNSQLAWSGNYNGPNFDDSYGGFAVFSYQTPS